MEGNSIKAKIIRVSKLKSKHFQDKDVTDILNAKDWPFSIAHVKKFNVDEGKQGTDKTNLAYYVLEGKGFSVINGKKHFVKKGDWIIIPKGTPYRNLSGLTLLAISYPRFKRSNRVYKSE